MIAVRRLALYLGTLGTLGVIVFLVYANVTVREDSHPTRVVPLTGNYR